MRKIIFVILLMSLVISSVLAQNIEYGYNMQGQYVPIAIGEEEIEYGYNMQGQYVPVSVGGRNIEYGYNMQGQYVVTGIEDFEPKYNQTRSYYPQSEKDFDRCRYATGLAGWSGNKNFMNMCR